MTLLDLWIITNDSGIIIYHKVKNSLTDDDCLGGFISAFICYIKNCFQERLDGFSITNFQFYLLKEHKITFIGKFPRRVEESIAFKELVETVQKFFRHFPRKQFDNWDFDVNKFTVFDEIIDISYY